MIDLPNIEDYLEYGAIIWLTAITMLIVAGSHR
jgi:hypothetical protein